MMIALRVVFAASALCTSVAFAAPTPSTTLEDDLSHAKANQATAQQLWSKNLDACLTRDTSALAQIQRSANEQLHSQDKASASRFPGCRLLLTDVLYFSGGCYTGKFTQSELDRVRANWERDSSDCAAQIATPSNNSETLSESEWEAEMRKEGTPDSEIELMKSLRKL